MRNDEKDEDSIIKLLLVLIHKKIIINKKVRYFCSKVNFILFISLLMLSLLVVIVPNENKTYETLKIIINVIISLLTGVLVSYNLYKLQGWREKVIMGENIEVELNTLINKTLDIFFLTSVVNDNMFFERDFQATHSNKTILMDIQDAYKILGSFIDKPYSNILGTSNSQLRINFLDYAYTLIADYYLHDYPKLIDCYKHISYNSWSLSDKERKQLNNIDKFIWRTNDIYKSILKYEEYDKISSTTEKMFIKKNFSQEEIQKERKVLEDAFKKNSAGFSEQEIQKMVSEYDPADALGKTYLGFNQISSNAGIIYAFFHISRELFPLFEPLLLFCRTFSNKRGHYLYSFQINTEFHSDESFEDNLINEILAPLNEKYFLNNIPEQLKKAATCNMISIIKEGLDFDIYA